MTEINSYVYMGLTLSGEEVAYAAYRRRKVTPEAIGFSDDNKALITRVSCSFGTAPIDWGPFDGFFLSNVEEGGQRIYEDLLKYPISAVLKGQNFDLVTYLTSPLKKIT